MFRFSFCLFRFGKDIGETRWDYCLDKRVIENKSFELQASLFPAHAVLDFQVDLHWWGGDHAGPEIILHLMWFYLGIKLYDHRHWNYEEGRWYRDGEETWMLPDD